MVCLLFEYFHLCTNFFEQTRWFASLWYQKSNCQFSGVVFVETDSAFLDLLPLANKFLLLSPISREHRFFFHISAHVLQRQKQGVSQIMDTFYTIGNSFHPYLVNFLINLNAWFCCLVWKSFSSFKITVCFFEIVLKLFFGAF